MKQRLNAVRIRAETASSWVLRTRRPTPALWAALVAAFALVALHGTSPKVLVSDMPLDIFVPLDGGWRTYAGQVPHVDFQTPVGRLYYDIYGLFMHWFGADVRVVLWVPAVLAPLLGVLTLAVTTGRVPALLATLASVYITLMAASPIHLDRGGLVHLASYNRIGWGLAVVVMIAAGIPRDRRSRTTHVFDALLCILVLVTLFYVKITYFALGGLALIVAVAVVPENRMWALTSGIVTWLIIGLTFMLSEVPLAYIDDIRAAAASVDPRWADVGLDNAPGMTKLSTDLLENIFTVLLVFAGLVAFSRTADEDPALEAVANRVGLAGAGLTGAALLVGLQSHDHHNPALLAATLVPVAAFARRALDGPRAARDRRVVFGLALATLFVYTPRVLREALGITTHRWLVAADDGLVRASDNPDSPLADLLFVTPSRWEESKLHLVIEGRIEPEIYREIRRDFGGQDIALMLQHADAAVREHCEPDAKTLTLLFTSPMSVFMGAPPPRNTLSWYHPGRTFGGDNPLDPETLLADVDVVLSPRTIGTPPTLAMAEALEPWLETHHRKVETPLWNLWIR